MPTLYISIVLKKPYLGHKYLTSLRFVGVYSKINKFSLPCVRLTKYSTLLIVGKCAYFSFIKKDSQ